MATLSIDGDDLVVRLGPWEKLGAASGDIRVPRRAIKQVRVTDQPFAEIRGWRVGTGLPGVVALGTWRTRGARDFVAVYRRQRGVVVELEGAPFERFVLTAPDPEAVQRQLASGRSFIPWRR
jgi:hypothetical protein